MTLINPIFSILITTKNRIADLQFTLVKMQHLLDRRDVECVIFDDGSDDGTFDFVNDNYPKIILNRNQVSKGYLFCRNKMLNETKADFAISLDDDAHFITENPLEFIQKHFEENNHCGLIAMRIFWGLEAPKEVSNSQQSHRVKGFVGCGHVWRMKAWRDIPNYPEWFKFYGEENFASLQLFKKNWKIHYVPQLFVQHRVDMKERSKSVKEFAFRYRRGIRADWCNYFLFTPISKIPRKMAYSIWIQFKNKIFKGNFKIIKPLFLAILDLVLFIPKLIKHRNSLTLQEYIAFCELDEVKIYWQPEK